MLYATPYYDNVKSCRRVGRLPTAGHGGGHPQAASFPWPAIPVDGDGRRVGEARPRGPAGSICPDTENAPSCDGAEKLRNIACPAKLPRTANRLLRSLRRQTKLSAEMPPSVSAGFAATGCQAQFLLLAEKHTFANAPGFRDEVPASPLLAQLPMDFGRIVLSVKPYSPGLPLSPSIRTVPPVAVRREVPHLDCSYCAP
jgi:hypothetical protein